MWSVRSDLRVRFSEEITKAQTIPSLLPRTCTTRNLTQNKTEHTTHHHQQPHQKLRATYYLLGVCPRQNSHTRASPGRDSEHNFLNVMLIEKQIFAPFLAPPLFPTSCTGPRPRNWKLTGLVPQRFKGPSTASTLLPAENDSLRASRPPHCRTGTVINS